MRGVGGGRQGEACLIRLTVKSPESSTGAMMSMRGTEEQVQGQSWRLHNHERLSERVDGEEGEGGGAEGEK